MGRKENKQLVDEYKRLLQPLIGVPLIISFDKFKTEGAIIEDIFLANTSGDKAKEMGLLNAPEKRNVDGKQVTPAVICIKTDEAPLFFVLEDIDILAVMGGVRIEAGSIVVEMRVIQ